MSNGHNRRVYPDWEIYRQMGYRPPQPGINVAPTQGAVSQTEMPQQRQQLGGDMLGSALGLGILGDQLGVFGGGEAAKAAEAFVPLEASPWINPDTGVAFAELAGPPLADPVSLTSGLSNLGIGGAELTTAAPAALETGGMFSSILPGAAGIGWGLPALAGIGVLGGLLDWW